MRIGSHCYIRNSFHNQGFKISSHMSRFQQVMSSNKKLIQLQGLLKRITHSGHVDEVADFVEGDGQRLERKDHALLFLGHHQIPVTSPSAAAQLAEFAAFGRGRGFLRCQSS